MAGSRRLRRADRLRRAADYQRVFRAGVRADGRLLSVVLAAGVSGVARLGLAAGRRVGGAVERNRAKRLVREGFRTLPRPTGFDVVVLPKAASVASSQGALATEFARLVERLGRRVKAVRRERSAAASD
jgi:ribonuclease P protein component